MERPGNSWIVQASMILGWKHQYSLEQGIQKAYSYFLKENK